MKLYRIVFSPDGWEDSFAVAQNEAQARDLVYADIEPDQRDIYFELEELGDIDNPRIYHIP